MTRLKFFDPSKKYGEFSNLSEVPVTLDGITYPTVQHAVYMKLLDNYGDILRNLRNPYDLRKNFELQLQAKFNNTVMNAIYSSYASRLKKDAVKLRNIDRNFVFRPVKLIDSRLKFVLGVDAFLYGYNIIGKTIEEIYHGLNFNDASIKNAIYLANIAANRLIDLLHEGSNLSGFLGLLPSQILQLLEYNIEDLLSDNIQVDIIHKQFIEGTLKHYNFIRNEILYPRSLVFFLLKYYSSFINFYIHKNILDTLMFDFSKQLLASEYDVPSNQLYDVFLSQSLKKSPEELQDYKERLLNLYAHNNLPITKDAFLIVSNLIKNRLSDSQINTYINFIPLNFIPKDAIELDGSGKHPLDPLFSINFSHEGFEFFNVLHCIYFIVLDSVLNNAPKAYALLLKNPKKKEPKTIDDFVNIETFSFDELYNKIFTNKIISILKKAMDEKFYSNPSIVQLLLQTEKNGISEFIYADPLDPIIGFDESLEDVEGNLMNQTGKYLLQIRSNISVDIKSEYDYFYTICGDEYFLHAWLKKQLMDLRICLYHFLKIYKDEVDLKNLKVFFAKIYTPFHTIYRFENIKNSEMNGFIKHFFQNLALSDECLQYIIDHFIAMYQSSLKNFDNSAKSLAKHLQTHKNEKILVNPEVIVKKLYSTLQYLPNKYSEETLSNLTSIYLISPTRITIPEKTFLTLSPNNYVYMYMISSISYLFEQMTKVSHNTIGNLSFCVNHIVNHISNDNYIFFF